MAYSDTKIANLGLARIGPDQIANLGTDTGVTARRAREAYEPIRDEVMQLYPWPFAKTRAALSLDAATPAFGYDYAYVLPADYLTAISLEDPDVEYEIEGGLLLTDAEEANLHYIRRVTDPTKFSPAFVKVFYLRLASVFAMSVAQSRSLQGEVVKEYDRAMMEAKAVERVADNKPLTQPSSYVDSRV